MDTNALNPDTSAELDPPSATTDTGSNILDVPLTPQQRSFLMSILGLGDSNTKLQPRELATHATIQTRVQDIMNNICTPSSFMGKKLELRNL